MACSSQTRKQVEQQSIDKMTKMWTSSSKMKKWKTKTLNTKSTANSKTRSSLEMTK